MQDYAHDKEQGSAKCRRSPLRDTASAGIYLPGLIRRSVDAGKSSKRFFRAEAAHIADLCHQLRAKDRTNAEHIHYNRIGSDDAWECISLRSAANADAFARSCKTASSVRCFVVSVFGMTPKF